MLSSRPLTTRQLTRGALLITVALVLSLTRLGEIPVPTPARAITWTHVPVILAGILLGPFMGGTVGLVWGWQQYLTWGGSFPDPTVHVLPRILVGVLSALAYRGVDSLLKNHSARLTAASATAAVVGTLVNTLGVLSLAVWRGFMPLSAAVTVAALHAPFELAVAVALTVPTVSAMHNLKG
jgi:uncharacterized membrane protein